MARCEGITAKGERCKKGATNGSFCGLHHPGRAKRKKEDQDRKKSADVERGKSDEKKVWRPKEMDSDGCMTQAAFARLLGVADQAVHSYRQRGIFKTNDDGLINVAHALASLQAKGDAFRSDSSRKILRPVGEGGGTKVYEVPREAIRASSGGSDDDLQTQKLRAQIEGLVHKARLHELRADEQEGRLIQREVVEREIFSVGRILRDRVFSIADRVAAELAGLTDAADIHRVLTAEITDAMTEAANALEEMEFEPDT